MLIYLYLYYIKNTEKFNVQIIIEHHLFAGFYMYPIEPRHKIVETACRKIVCKSLKMPGWVNFFMLYERHYIWVQVVKI